MGHKLGHFDIFNMLFPFLAFSKIIAHNFMKSRSCDVQAAKGLFNNSPLLTTQTLNLVPKLVSYIYMYLEQPCSQGRNLITPWSEWGLSSLAAEGGKVRDLETRLVP